jgi:hypothetical protein
MILNIVFFLFRNCLDIIVGRSLPDLSHIKNFFNRVSFLSPVSLPVNLLIA